MKYLTIYLMMTAVQGLCGLSNTQASNIVKNARVHNFTPQQIVAITILAEARGEGERGMYAVACVIAQRAIEGKTRPDLVCIAPAQFSCWNPSNAQYKKLNSFLTIPESVYALRLVDKPEQVETLLCRIRQPLPHAHGCTILVTG